MSKTVVKNILRFALGVLVLGIIQEIIILVFFSKSPNLLPMLLGTLYGCAYVVLSFTHMGYCVEKCVDKGENDAKLYMQTRYTSRMLVLLAVMIAAVYIPFVNIYTSLIPLTFTRIIVTVMGLISSKLKGGESE